MFNKKSSKHLNNKVSISLAFGAGMLLFAGCTSTATAPNNTQTQAQTVTAKKEDSTTARYAVNMFNNFIAPMIFGFTKEEYACFSEVENDFAEQQAQQVIQQYIPIEKQQELNQFFASETAKKAAAFYAKTGELQFEARENKDIDMDAELEAYTESLNLTEQELQNFQAFIEKNLFNSDDSDNDEIDILVDKLMVSVLNKKVDTCHAKGKLTSLSIEEYYKYLGSQGLR